MTRNRRRYTAARASLRRIVTAATIAAAATLAALGWTAAEATSARWTDESTAAAIAYLTKGEPCTLGELHHAPAELRAAAWSKWSHRPARLSGDPITTAASARVIDFATGKTDSVSEEDLQNASLPAVQAAIASGRLD
jgi:hypothetical protein